MPTAHLVTYAAMPAAGTYVSRRVTAEEFGDLVRAAAKSGCLRSWVGHEQSIDIAETLAGVSIPLVREWLRSIEDGDAMLFMPLKPRPRGEKTTRDVILRVADFEYFVVTYSAS